MSQNKDKPADPDPDATVTFQRGNLLKPDDDATVMMARDALKAPDEDATVMMTRDSLKAPDDRAPDEDVTVMMPKGGLKAMLAAEAAAAAAASSAAGSAPFQSAAPSTGLPLPAFRSDADPDATVVATAPPPQVPPILPVVPSSSSRMPMMVGGLVVVAVLVYFVVSGGKSPTVAPVTAKPEAAAPAPSAATPTPAAPVTAPAAPAATVASAQSAVQAKLADLLAADIKAGRIKVTQEGGTSTITLSDANQFASGGVDPDAKLRPVLLNIGAALNKSPGAILVIGHADANPSSNPGFPSNQALSAARAASAAKAMAPKLDDPKRLSSEGAGDLQPLGPSDTAANRAKNRRVVIVVKPAS